MDEYLLRLAGRQYRVWDSRGSCAARIVAGELENDAYQLGNIQLNAGDVVVDVGGHIGLFAIYVATRWPDIVVHSFEPFESNSALFERNVRESGLTNIRLHKYGVSKDGRLMDMASNPTNSGGATSFSRELCHLKTTNIKSVTLDEAFAEHKIKTCALLKVDCEGAEYEILSSTSVLGRVKHLRAELHVNGLLAARGCDPQQLVRHCVMSSPQCDSRFTLCAMSE
jgi:FkbM family methyltransferase